MHILIIDDSKAVHALLGIMLDGYVVTFSHAYSGKEGLDILRGEGFRCDLILLDWEMPILNGIDALKQIKVDFKSMTVLMMTSLATLEHISIAMEAGASDYLMKPFTQEILIEKLQQLSHQEVIRNDQPSA